MPSLREQWLKQNGIRDRTIEGEAKERLRMLEERAKRSPQEKRVDRLKMAKRLLTAIQKYYDSYYQVGSQIGKKITSLVPTKIDDALFNFAGEATRVRDDLYNQLFEYVIAKVNNELELERREKNEYKEQENGKQKQKSQENSSQQEKGEYP